MGAAARRPDRAALADLGRIDEARALITKLLSDANTAEDRMYQLYLRAADIRLSARRGELSRADPAEWARQVVKRHGSSANRNG
jgi:hypothetical protein